MKLDERQRSRIAGKLVEVLPNNDEPLLKRLFIYDYHQLIPGRLMRSDDDQ